MLVALALDLRALRLALLADRGIAGFVGKRHRPPASRPVLQLLGKLLHEARIGVGGEREGEDAILAAHQPDVALQRRHRQRIALLLRQRHELRETVDPHRRRRRRSGLRRSRSGIGRGHHGTREGSRRRAAATTTRRRSGRAGDGARAVAQHPERLVRRRQVGRIGEAHEQHLRRHDRARRGLHLGEALAQDLPGPRQRPDRERGREFLPRRRSVSVSVASSSALGASLRRVTVCTYSARSATTPAGSARNRTGRKAP